MRWLRLCIVLVLWALAGSTLQAQSPASGYTGADILFVIDHSGSMGGEECGGSIGSQPNDPLGLRFLGPQYAIQWLTSLVDSVVGNDAPEVRFGLLAFGSDSRPIIADWTVIGAKNPGWNLQQILADLSVSRFTTARGNCTTLGYTNFLDAFDEARGYFQRARSAGANDQRLSVMILLTDGAPCVPQSQETINTDCARATWTPYLNTLLADRQRNLPNVQIYVIALDDDFWAELEDDWQGVACDATADCALHAAAVIENQDLSAQFNKVLADVFQQLSGAYANSILTNVPPGDFEVPPYTQLLRLNIFKTRADPSNVKLLKVVDPTTKNPVTSQVTGADTPIETHDVLRPDIGGWELDTSSLMPEDLTDYVWSVDTVAAGLRAGQVPTNPVSYAPFEMTVELVDTTGNVMPVYPGNAYPLSVELVFYDATLPVRDDRPVVFRIPTQPDADSGLNRFRVLLRPTQAGTFEIRANASYPDPVNGTTHMLAQDETLVDSMTIDPAQLLWQNPAPDNQRVDLPVRVAARILDPQGNPLAGSDGLVMQVTLLDQSRNPVAPPQVFQPAGPGTFESDVTFDTPGIFVLRQEIGVPDPQGAFLPLGGDASQDSVINLRQVFPLALTMSQPAETSQPAQADFPNFTAFNPVTVRAELRDSSGNPVSLSALTGGQERAPTLTITRNGEPAVPGAALNETSAGVYEWTGDTLAEGDYLFTASVTTPADRLNGDFTWQNTRASLSQQRFTAPYIAPLLAAILLALLAVIGGIAYFLWRQVVNYRTLRMNPLNGTISLYWIVDGGSPDPLQRKVLNLATLGVNRFTFKSRNLMIPFERLTVTNNGSAEMLENGSLFIPELRIKGIKIENITLLQGPNVIDFPNPGNEPITYFIGRNTEFDW